jgi:hypothetical protein
VISNEYLWRVLEGALGSEKVAYLRYAPLDEIVLNKMAQDYPEQTMPEYITLPLAMRHITEKHAFAKRRWQMVESGIEAIRQLRAQGLYKRASLLPRGSLRRKIAVRDRLLLAASGGGEAREKVAAILPEYDRQLRAYLGEERFEKVAKAGFLRKAYQAVDSSTPGRAALQGLGVGAGLAVPATAVGYHLIGRAEDKAKQMALPMAAAGAGSAFLGGLGEAVGERLVGG